MLIQEERLSASSPSSSKVHQPSLPTETRPKLMLPSQKLREQLISGFNAAEIAICLTDNGDEQHLYICFYIYIYTYYSFPVIASSFYRWIDHAQPRSPLPQHRGSRQLQLPPRQGPAFRGGHRTSAGVTRAEPASAGHIVLLPSAHVSAS